MVTQTPNYNWDKPDVGGDKDTWGAIQNGALDQVDTQVRIVEDITGDNALAISQNATNIGLNADDIAINKSDIADLQDLIAALTPTLQIQIGSFYTCRNEIDAAAVAALLGYGTWAAALIGRVMVGAGTGDAPDATPWAVGEKRGTEEHTITIPEMPIHNHDMLYRERLRDGTNNEVTDFGGNDQSKATADAGGDQPHNNIQPSEVYFIYERLT